MSVSERISRRQALIGAVVVLAAIAAGSLNHWQSGGNEAEPAYWQHEAILIPLDKELSGGIALAAMFSMDEQGRLLVDHVTKAALDALWWELSEAADAALALENMQGRLRAALPGATGRRAAALLGSYQAYRLELEAEAPADASSGDAIERQLQRQIAVRQRHFDDATAALLFGEEEAYLRLLAAAMRTEADELTSIPLPQELRDEVPGRQAGAAESSR